MTITYSPTNYDLSNYIILGDLAKVRELLAQENFHISTVPYPAKEGKIARSLAVVVGGAFIAHYVAQGVDKLLELERTPRATVSDLERKIGEILKRSVEITGSFITVYNAYLALSSLIPKPNANPQINQQKILKDDTLLHLAIRMLEEPINTPETLTALRRIDGIDARFRTTQVEAAKNALLAERAAILVRICTEQEKPENKERSLATRIAILNAIVDRAIKCEPTQARWRDEWRSVLQLKNCVGLRPYDLLVRGSISQSTMSRPDLQEVMTKMTNTMDRESGKNPGYYFLFYRGYTLEEADGPVTGKIELSSSTSASSASSSTSP